MDAIISVWSRFTSAHVIEVHNQRAVIQLHPTPPQPCAPQVSRLEQSHAPGPGQSSVFPARSPGHLTKCPTLPVWRSLKSTLVGLRVSGGAFWGARTVGSAPSSFGKTGRTGRILRKNCPPVRINLWTFEPHMPCSVEMVVPAWRSRLEDFLVGFHDECYWKITSRFRIICWDGATAIPNTIETYYSTPRWCRLKHKQNVTKMLSAAVHVHVHLIRSFEPKGYVRKWQAWDCLIDQPTSPLRSDHNFR